MIYEYEAPPTAYIEFEGSGTVIRFKHRTLSLVSNNVYDLYSVCCFDIRQIKAELQSSVGDSGIAFIFWRQRMQIEEKATYPQFVLQARLATSPSLSEEFWANLTSYRLEGAEAKVLS